MRPLAILETNEERSLLLYLETCLVDQSGRVNGVHMNESDMEIVDKWKKSEFIWFGRIASENVTSRGALWVRFSDAAWRLAHAERKARAERLQEKRTYITTEEKRSGISAAESSE